MNRLFLTLIALFLAGCNDSSTPISSGPVVQPPVPPVMVDYEISITNMTLAQPLSPAAVVAHLDGWQAATLGTAASAGLELLAEGGDNADFLAEATADALVAATASGSDAVGPGNTGTVTLTLAENLTAGLAISVVSMLVNTNDAFIASEPMLVASLAVGDMTSALLTAFDAGTEANSEAAGTIPGPADGGEGFNALRDDIADAIRGHSGVVTSADGLATSVLGENHRWDNPVARVTITRVR